MGMLKSDPVNPERGVLAVVALMCLAETLSMTGFAAYPAFLALLRDTWSISNSEAGFIGGAYFAGYMTAVPVLSSLTDRYDARRIHVGSCLLAAVSTLGFAFFAEGVVSAAGLQALAGAGLGGTYMPGLKALTDRVTGPRQSRYIAFYQHLRDRHQPFAAACRLAGPRDDLELGIWSAGGRPVGSRAHRFFRPGASGV